jgi:hypothetical protein
MPVVADDLAGQTIIFDEWCLAAFSVSIGRCRRVTRKSALGDERQRRGLVRGRPELRGVQVAVELEGEELFM